MATHATQYTNLLSDAMTHYVGAVNNSIKQFVELYDPGKAYQFELASRDLFAAIGSMLVPAMETATKIATALNEAITGLGGPSKTMIAGIVFAGIAASVAAAATLTLGTVVAGLAVVAAVAAFGVGILGTTVAALAVALNYATFGLAGVAATVVTVATAAAGAGAGLLGFAAVFDKTGSAMGMISKLFDSFSGVLDTLMGVAFKVIQAVMPLALSLGQLAASLLKLYVALQRPAFEMFMNMTITLLTLAADSLLVFTEAILALLRALHLIDKEDAKVNKPKTTAVSSAAFMSGESFAQKAYTNAYALGEKQSEAQKQTTKLDGIHTTLAELTGYAKRLADLFTNEKKGVTNDKIPLPLPSNIPGLVFQNIGPDRHTAGPGARIRRAFGSITDVFR